MVYGPILTPHFPETNTQKKVVQIHRHPVTYTKKLPFKPTQTQSPRFTCGLPAPHPPIHTRRLSPASPPTHRNTHKQAHVGTQLPSRRQTHDDKRTKIKPQIHSFTCLVWGGAVVVWGQACGKPKFRKQREIDAKLSHLEVLHIPPTPTPCVGMLG